MKYQDRIRLDSLAERFNGKGLPLYENELAELETLSRLELNESETDKQEWPGCFGDPGPAL